MNHHIRNAMQVILSRATLDSSSQQQLADITGAIDRIERALRR